MPASGSSELFRADILDSWMAALGVAGPQLIRHAPVPQLTGILMFPAMLLGPPVAAIALTRIVDGKNALTKLWLRIVTWRVPVYWYAALLIPPAPILAVLFCLEIFVSPVYRPNRFLAGILFGVPAGLLEEVGWTGYAFPKMHRPNHPFTPAVLLGILWGLWHLPVINFLGTTIPHGSYWLSFFFVFTVAMTAIRVLICWIYIYTRSVLMAQLMHISSTGSLVVFSAPRVTAAQEVMWYGVYGASLWLIVWIVCGFYGKLHEPTDFQ